MQCTRILLIRHGETAWNAHSRIQGHTDIGLNDVGRAQAQRLARAVTSDPDLALDIIYSSDLMRAVETARAVADATGTPLEATDQLRERCFGSFEGHTFAQITATHSAEAERWRRRDPDWSPPHGGESLLFFQERVTQAVSTLAAKNMGKHIGVFTHGGVLDVLYRHATGLGLQDARTWRLGNAAINRLLWTPDAGLRLVGWADTFHLDESPLDERTS